MIGDHNQLPPVVKNMAFQKFGHLDQSLFTRFIRLGVPHLQLDSQGRTRPSIAELYNWRYPSLGNLPRVLNSPEYHMHNAGFMYPFQFINVVDFKGKVIIFYSINILLASFFLHHTYFWTNFF